MFGLLLACIDKDMKRLAQVQICGILSSQILHVLHNAFYKLFPVAQKRMSNDIFKVAYLITLCKCITELISIIDSLC